MYNSSPCLLGNSTTIQKENISKNLVLNNASEFMPKNRYIALLIAKYFFVKRWQLNGGFSKDELWIGG